MVKIELTHPEAELLHKILGGYLAELAVEMSANGIEDFTGVLQQETKAVEKILEHLKAQGIGILTPEMLGEYS